MKDNYRERPVFRSVFLQYTATASLLALATGASAYAQEVAQAVNMDDIIVTARKRSESSLSVPVAITAVSGAQLSNRGIVGIDAIARLVPTMIVGPSSGGAQGGLVTIRGIAGPDSNPFGDQAVSFNVDGVAIGKSSVRRMVDTDLAQVEVYKGPQALFYGKNSPAGVVSMKSADPGDRFEAKLSAGYELEADEFRTEGYVSAPLTDSLGIRVAGIYSTQKGWVKYNVPANSVAAASTDKRGPDGESYGGRITLKYDPDSNFSAKLKINYGKVDLTGGMVGTAEYFGCPTGSLQSGSIDDCKANGKTQTTGSGPAVGMLNPDFGDGHGFMRQTQFLTSLELGYNLGDNLNLTSVTGFYRTRFFSAANHENDYSIALPSRNIYRDNQFSEEIRAVSSFDGPLNFSAGAYYSTTSTVSGANTWVYAMEPSGLNALALSGLGFVPLNTPFSVGNYLLKQEGSAYSAYLQMIYKPIDQVEIDVGGRYSHETKKLVYVYDQAPGFTYHDLTAADDIISTVSPTKRSFNDFSPEVTVSYRPTQALTLFGSYKHGFLSGGFNAQSGLADLSFEPERIKGFEGGVKALLLDNSLRINASLYSYKMKGLQLTGYKNVTSTIRNVGGGTVKGFEVDFSYRTPLEGLSLNGAFAYNRAKYSSFAGAPCYNGQTIAMGCSFAPGAGVPTQDLSGSTFARAPKINLVGGFDFESNVSGNVKIGLNGTATYISRYFTDIQNSPIGIQQAYTLIDAGIRIGDVNDVWKAELIGRNLTDKYYNSVSFDAPFTGSAAGGTTGTLADRFGGMSRGREVMIRLSYMFK